MGEGEGGKVPHLKKNLVIKSNGHLKKFSVQKGDNTTRMDIMHGVVLTLEGSSQETLILMICSKILMMISLEI